MTITEKEIELTKTTEIKTFKARIKASKPHFVQKVMVHKTRIDDALEPHFQSFITIFAPKLKPRQLQPVVMCHVSNGAGSCMFRCKGPNELANVLRYIADELTSDTWLSKWMQLESIADKLKNHESTILDEDFLDIGDFKKLLETSEKERVSLSSGMEVEDEHPL